MKKAFKRTLASVLVAVMVLTAAPLSGIANFDWGKMFEIKASAAELAPTGQCGEKVYWTFDESTGLLTIRGTGEMRGYSSGDSPFYKNSLIRSVVINNGITSIGSYAFESCTGLISITILDSVITIDSHSFFKCKGLTNVTIGHSVTNIGESAFYGCIGLTNITIPDSVTSIGDAAFSHCTGLTGVILSNSVTSIGYDAFYNCTGLTSITIPNSVTSIDNDAFNNCTGLTSITIPNSVTSIGIYAFYYCYNLKDVYYTGTQSQWNSVSIGRNNSYLQNATIHYVYSLTFDTKGGVISPNYVIVNPGESVTIPTSKPIRVGYNFLGWSISSTATSASYQPGDTITISKNTILYAVWKQTSISSGSSVNTSISYGGQIYYYEFTPSASGNYVVYSTGTADTYVYLYNSSGTQLSYNDDGGENTNFRLSYSLTAGTTYYYGIKYYSSSNTGTIAVKFGPVYTISYNANGGSGAPSNQSKDWGKDITLSTVKPVNGCKTFIGWSTSDNAVTADYYPSAVYSSNSNLTLYAVWGQVIHKNTVSEVIAPTCTTEGFTKYTCSDCGEAYIDNYVPALGHDYSSDWTVDAEATCVKEGSKSHHCTRCEDKKDITGITPLGHSYGSWISAVDPKCETDGTDYRECQRSGCEHREYRTTEATGHSYTHITNPATCTVNGIEYDLCTKCSKTENVITISALGHNWGEWQTITAATSTTDGLERRTCSRCTETEERIIPKPEHDFVPEVIAPTCTTEGFTKYTCTDCGEMYIDDYVPALGHDYSTSWTVDAVATCTAVGSKSHHCTRCDSKTDITVIPATGIHNNVHKVTPATCTKNGAEFDLCTDCFEISNYEVIPALGHNWGEWIVETEGDCTVEGLKYRVCSVCDEREEEHITAGHDYISESTEPTCTEQGYTTHTCKKCGDSFIDSCTPALGHDWSEWIVTTDATCTQSGTQKRVCSECLKKEKQTISALGHDYEVTEKTVTCEMDGGTYHICKNCGDSFVTDEVKATGHTWSDWYTVEEPTEASTGLMLRYCETCDKLEKTVIPCLVPIDAGSIKLSSNDETVLIGSSITLSAVVLPEDSTNKNVLWTTSDSRVAVVNNGTVTAKNPGTAVITAATENGKYCDYCLIKVVGITASNADVVIDAQSSMIYGLSLYSGNLNECFDFSDSSISVEAKTENIGTGTQINVIIDNDVIGTYKAVVFGDVNGDGWYDGMDAMLVNCIVSGMISESDIGEAAYTAADCNHDGVIDQLDVDILNEAGILLAQIDQSKTQDELIETGSAYAEYLNLVNQIPESKAETAKREEKVEKTFLQRIIELITRIIAAVTAFISKYN